MTAEYNPFTLQEKTILVTGASSGIGRAIAVMCSRMGASVIATGRNQERLEETVSLMEGSGNMMVAADLTDMEETERLADSCPALDGIVHNAGVMDRILSRMIGPEEIEKIMKPNFEAPVLLQKALLKKKKLKAGASVVFIASRAAFAPTVGNSLYAASKGAIVSYSKVLALELADRKIRVNSICPGMVWTDLIRRDAELAGVDYSEIQKNYPLKRFGQPDDVASLTVFLLSDASSWMTGSCIDLTGGGELLLK